MDAALAALHRSQRLILGMRHRESGGRDHAAEGDWGQRWSQSLPRGCPQELLVLVSPAEHQGPSQVDGMEGLWAGARAVTDWVPSHSRQRPG